MAKHKNIFATEKIIINMLTKFILILAQLISESNVQRPELIIFPFRTP